MIDSVSESSAGLPDLKKARRKRNASDGLKIDRLPPHSEEMERGVLGCIFLSPKECIPQVAQRLPDGSEELYDMRNQTIYTVMVEMHEQNETIDVLTVYQRLKDRQLIDQIGGIPYLNALQDAVPSSANITYYADIVHEKYLLRKLIHTCTDSVGKVYEFEGDVDQLLDEVERDILKIRSRRITNRKDIKELVQASINVIEDKWNRKGTIGGLSTGFIDLDNLTDGLYPGELIVPAAYPSVGKTSLLMNIVENVVLVQKKSAAVFSMEMTAEQLVTRFICSHARVNIKRISQGWIIESDLPKLTSAAGKTKSAKLYVIDDVETIQQIRMEARRLKQENPIDLIGVDYIQRVGANLKGTPNREQEVASISNNLKSMAKELGVPVIAPSQLNEDGKLRESRAIGQDADQIWNLEPQEEGKTQDSETVNLWIRKNRNGPRDVCVPLTFLKCYTRFESASKVSDEDVPRD